MLDKSKQDGKPAFRVEPKAFFDLPRTVSKVIRECATVHESDTTTGPTIRYLWMNIAGRDEDRRETGAVTSTMNVDDWLNIIDEAAAVGVSCVVICVGDVLRSNPDLWAICRWAQRAHGLDVGIYARCSEVGPNEVSELRLLDGEHTWLFVDMEYFNRLRDLEHYNIRVRVADVCREDHEPPCDMPDDLVFVAPDGNLYTCGLVIDNTQYRLGHIMERPLNRIIGDESLPRFVPKTVPYRENGCAGCPPILVKRMTAESAQRSTV